MKHKQLLYILGLIILIAGVALGIHLASTKSAHPAQQSAQQIPQGTYFAKVRQLSAGTKPACLTPDPSLDPTVQADDQLPYEKSMSPALGTVIPDMPAGRTSTHLHSYSSTSATGYETFSDKNQQAFVGDLKSFNFNLQRSDANAAWKLTSFIACTD